MGHSTLKNRVHITYLRVINLCDFGLRQRDDYRMIQILYEDTVKKFGYSRVHEPLIAKLQILINEGLFIHGRKHAVRLAYLQVIIFYLIFA